MQKLFPLLLVLGWKLLFQMKMRISFEIWINLYLTCRFLCFILVLVTLRAFSSVGQSNRLITGWSGVRVPEGPPVLYGGIPKWPKGADCKSVVTDFDGSNPSPSTNKKTSRSREVFLSSHVAWRAGQRVSSGISCVIVRLAVMPATVLYSSRTIFLKWFPLSSKFL